MVRAALRVAERTASGHEHEHKHKLPETDLTINQLFPFPSPLLLLVVFVFQLLHFFFFLYILFYFIFFFLNGSRLFFKSFNCQFRNEKLLWVIPAFDWVRPVHSTFVVTRLTISDWISQRISLPFSSIYHWMRSAGLWQQHISLKFWPLSRSAFQPI